MTEQEEWLHAKYHTSIESIWNQNKNQEKQNLKQNKIKRLVIWGMKKDHLPLPKDIFVIAYTEFK